jgi:hypothetical protein
MTDRLHPSSINDLRQLVRLHGPERVAAALDDVTNQEFRRPSPTERRAAALHARGLKGDGTDVIQAKDACYGDVVRLNLRGETMNPYSHCTVIKIDKQDTYNAVKLFRPYVHTSEFVTTGGIIPYVGFEEFTVHGTTELVVVRANTDEVR